ncbi:MAG: two-component system response regulator [Opitutales bacterium]
MPHARILIVEDEPDLIDLITCVLARDHHDIAGAGTGWEALAEIGRQRPDLILLDLMLPDLDGFGLCEILRRDPATARIPIIIVSAWASPDSQQLGNELGAVDYLTKPFSPHELRKRVNHCLDLSANRTAN